MSHGIPDFIQRLKITPHHSPVFNPWWQIDETNDASGNAPQIRRQHLECYFSARLDSAKVLIIGEALGYQGGHFSGLAMTSERMLLGHKRDLGVDPAQVLPGLDPRRTSKQSLRENGFSEPTASIVWGALLNCGVAANEFVLWNAFPWHPFDKNAGILSNRKPTSAELRECIDVLESFLALFHFKKIIALGSVPAQQLEQTGRKALRLRHPASGGAWHFRQGILKLLG